MTEHLRPSSVADLALAPVLIGIERNLAWLRNSKDLQLDLAVALNDDDSFYYLPRERALRLQRCVVRGLDLHGWRVNPTEDLHGLAVSHGDFTVSLMFGAELVRYVAEHRLFGPSSRAK
jgi:hypothetical protein